MEDFTKEAEEKGAEIIAIKDEKVPSFKRNVEGMEGKLIEELKGESAKDAKKGLEGEKERVDKMKELKGKLAKIGEEWDKARRAGGQLGEEERKVIEGLGEQLEKAQGFVA